jgi:hypothetical protein
MTIIDSQVHAYEANTPKRPWHSVLPIVRSTNVHRQPRHRLSGKERQAQLDFVRACEVRRTLLRPIIDSEAG